MKSTVFADNLKKFRLAKNLTQEQVAAHLCVNTQTVSRWECASTLPDALTLPDLARLYGVTVDDFYKERSVAYDNYAQRLSSVYEKTRKPEDFFRCTLEYEKMIAAGELSMADRWNYATVHHFMMRYCKDTALTWYEKVLSDDPQKNLHIYERALSLRDHLLFEIGKGDEVLSRQKELAEQNPDSSLNWEHLVELYLYAHQYEEAYNYFQKAIKKFPNSWVLYIFGGDICAALKKYEEAFQYWDKADEIGTAFYDELYCKAICYNNMGEYEKAISLYLEIAQKLRSDHYDEEAEMAEKEAHDIRLKRNLT